MIKKCLEHRQSAQGFVKLFFLSKNYFGGAIKYVVLSFVKCVAVEVLVLVVGVQYIKTLHD
jgi:hypothetical protein